MAQARRRFVLFVFLAVMLLEIPGVSADNTQATSLTIHAANENCSFSVYQIFTGSVSGNALADIAVGMHFDLNKFNRSLLRDAVLSVELPEDFEFFSTADEVAKFMESSKDDPDLITALANVLGKSLKSGADPLKIDTCEPAVNGYDYTLTGLTPGYYLVQEDIAASDNTKQYSRYILAVVGQAEINIKTTKAPTIKKSITVPEPGTSACAAIGETIQYELRSSVPDMTGYSSYSFVVVDTLSKGLAFQNDVEITLGDRTLSNKRDYTVTFQTNPDTGKTTVKIVFKNFYPQIASAN